MTDTCTTNTKSCGCQKGYRCSLVAMVGSGSFLLLAVNALLMLANRHMRHELAWDRGGVIDASITAAMALFALVVLVDAVRSFRRGSLGKLAFFGVLMVWSMVITLVLLCVLIQLVPSLV